MSSDERLRWGAAACRVDFGNPADRAGIKARVENLSVAGNDEAIAAAKGELGY